MPLQTHLFRRGSTYYFRAKVPVDLQSHLGKVEVKYSLKTRDPAEARSLARQASADFDRRCAELRDEIQGRQPKGQPRLLDDATIQEICALWRHQALAGDEDTRMEGAFNSEWEEHQAQRQETQDGLKAALRSNNVDAVEPALSLFLHLNGLEVRGDASQHRKLRYRFLQTITEVHDQQLARDTGEVVWTPEAPVQTLSPMISAQGAQQRPGATKGLSFDEAFDAWKRFDPSRPLRTVKDVARAIHEFRELTGYQTLDQVERSDVIRYRDTLTERGKQPKTVGKKLAFLCALFNVAIDNGRLTYNPASRVKLPKSKGRGRVPLDLDDLKRVFRSPIFTEGQRLGRDTGESAVWLPLISLYHGCREEEIAQLLVDDIQRIDGIWCLLITDLNDDDDEEPDELEALDESGKKLKNTDSRRRLPIHPELIRLGLLRYHAGIKRQGAIRLFPTLKPDTYGTYSAGFSKAFMGYFRKTLGIKDLRKTFHSLRHNFRDACREADLDEEISDALMGHSNGKNKSGRKYGSGFSLNRLYEAIQKVAYPGLSITPIIPEDRPE